MEAGEENGGNVSLKRPRVPLSDSEDNIIFSAPEMSEGQKRRRLEAADQENRSPKSSSSGRLAELEMKPDTPMVPSVRSRVQQLAQSTEGGSPLVQRCCSDEDPSVVLHDRGFGEHLLGEEEFNQRMDRFKVPVFQASPATTPSPANPCPRTRSDFVSGIQQKLQGSTTPSSKQASRIRQEREQELSQLHFQPISENVWLKRSNSDPSLTQQVQGDAEIKDGSFTEAATSSAEKPLTATGQRAAGPSEAPAASAEFESSGEGRSAHHSEEVREEEEHKASVGNEEEQLGSHPAESQTVMMLSFSSDHSFSKAAFSEDQIVSELPRADEQRFAESTSPDESNLLEATEEGSSERFTFDEDEKMEECLYSEEEIEPLSDEELKTWRYPRPVVSEDQEVFTKEEGGELGCRTTVGLLEEKSGQEVESEPESCLDDSAKDRSTLGRDEEKVESCEGALTEDITVFTMKHEQKETDGCFHEDETRQQSKKSQTVSRNEDVDLKSDSSDKGTETEAAPFADEARAQTETPTGLERNIEDVAPPAVEAQAASSDVDGDDGAQSRTEIRASDRTEEDPVDERQGVLVKGGTQKAEGGEGSKKVTFVLKPEVINTSVESSLSEAELSSHDETNTAEIIDQMFEEVLEYAGRMEGERRDAEEHDSGIVVCSGDKDNMDTEPEKEKGEEEAEPKKDECDESRKLEGNGDELLTFPQSVILSPLSKSVEAVVTPLRLAAKQESNPPSLLLTPDGASIPPAESAPLYSIDAYRTQRQSKLPTIQSVTPGLQRRAAETSKPQPSVNTKEKITALNEEAGKLQTVINQTLHALSCCTDEVHGRGSLEEAEAEKLLLVSCEKRSALLADAARLRDERSSDSGEAAGEDREYASQQPSRGTVGITNIQLPLKVEFVCSSHNRAGRPSHYFFILIRYGPCNIVATPLATAADAQNGDTISFPTSVTLKDIRSSFEIDVEVYSLSHTSGSSCSVDRTNAKSRVTPRKLLNTITRSSNSLTSAALPALNTRRSSNFCLVGSHKITLASLGHSKFPLDKMKLEGKIRRLLGDEFQEKVPFLSPLEGNIYLQLDSMSHSDVQHQGFLTMFELISGYGVWHRRYFVLEGCNLFYWNHPNDKETKEAEGSVSLSGSPSRCVRPVRRDSCARPFTFELVSNVPQQQQEDGSQDALAKCWFSADTKQERLDWMENLNQALLDFHTWNRPQTENRQSNSSVSGNLRESIL